MSCPRLWRPAHTHCDQDTQKSTNDFQWKKNEVLNLKKGSKAEFKAGDNKIAWCFETYLKKWQNMIKGDCGSSDTVKSRKDLFKHLTSQQKKVCLYV